MLPLDSPDWTSLVHAYGKAENIPGLLKQLSSFPQEGDKAEPWRTLWSSLCHQDDVYSASFASVPHIVQALSLSPERATMSYFLLPVAIELSRHIRGINSSATISDGEYFAAINQLGELAEVTDKAKWDIATRRAALAAIAIKNKQYAVAERLMAPDD